MTPSSVASASFFCLLVLLLPAQHVAYSYASYKVGSRQFFSRTSGNSQQASTVSAATTCSSLATGLGDNKLPIVHRQSPCSQLHGLRSLTAADVLRRDASLISSRFCSQSSLVTALAPPPATTVPAPPPTPTAKAPPPAPIMQASPPAPTVKAPSQTPTMKAPPLAPITQASPPAPTMKAPSPAPTLKAPPPAQTVQAPPPSSTVQAPPPSPSVKAPPSALTAPTPSPAPTTPAPSPAPTTRAPSPAPTAKAPSPVVTTIPANGSSDPRTLPGALDYSVLVSYGMPEQQFPVLLDTSSVGASMLRCKPCASDSDDCDPAFDTSLSSTFTNIFCGSPDCPTNCSGDSLCPLDGPYSVINGTFAEDTLTLSPSTTIYDFKFVCQGVHRPGVQPVAGNLDLSRDRNSLPSQLLSSGQAPTTAFSYCLPKSSSTQGFLSLGVNATVKNNNVTAHAPLVSNGNPELASMYFIDLVGMSVGDEDLPIPAGTFGNSSTNLDVGTTFTTLAPDAYTALRDSFQRQMSQYNFSSPGIDGFDTCFNFTDLNDLVIPNVQFKFSNGDILVIHADQMLYYDDTDAAPFTVACLAFSSLDAGDSFSAVIGSYTLATTEVVFDVDGGEVGFIPWSC